MAFEIVWTSTAWESYSKILFYLRENWGDSVTVGFIGIVETKIDQLSKQPFIGRLSIKDGETRMVLLTKQNKLYYQILNNTIELLEILIPGKIPSKTNLNNLPY